MSKVGRFSGKDSDETLPAWQGMQYVVSMFIGEGQLRHVGNERFAGREWGTVRDVLAAHVGGVGRAPAGAGCWGSASRAVTSSVGGRGHPLGYSG